jgi:hypothetical protein
MMITNVVHSQTRHGVLVLLGLALAGCVAPLATHHGARAEPFYTPKNVTGEPHLPAGMRRVVLLPVCGGGLVPAETATVLDRVFSAALLRQARFEVVSFSREDCQRWFGSSDFSSTAALPHGFIQTVASRHAADAVIFVDVTAYSAYRPLVLGIRAKLATAEDIHLVWAIDEVFSAAEPAVARSAHQYFAQNDHQQLPVDLSSAMEQSPARFGAYVADTVFRTLPPR